MEDNRNQEVQTYAVYEGHMDDLMKKVNRIKNKCIKFGCDFSFEQVGEEFRDVKTPEGETMKCKFILVKADATAVINGWEVVASVEHTEAGNIYSKTLTDIEIPVKYRTTQCICEHCKTKRIRKNTFIIRNTESGEFKQIGNSCLMDYTHGMSAQFATMVASFKSIFEEAEEAPISGCSWYQKFYSVQEVLQYTAETIKHFGYTKSDDSDSTKSRMLDFFNYLHGNTRFWTEEYKQKVQDMIDLTGFNPDSEYAVKTTEDALAWIAEQDASNDYMHNLKTVTSLKAVDSYKFGLLVSLSPTWNRELEYQARKKKEAESGKMSKHVGEVGQRLTIKVESVKCLTAWESCYNGYSTVTTYVWKIVDTEGNVFTWKTSNYLNEDVPPVAIKGTVKEHKEFRGVLQTELTRCKVQGVA